MGTEKIKQDGAFYEKKSLQILPNNAASSVGYTESAVRRSLAWSSKAADCGGGCDEGGVLSEEACSVFSLALSRATLTSSLRSLYCLVSV